jgi:lysophospholipid acyltransferase (LPLAT)-like uncharacterized protein
MAEPVVARPRRSSGIVVPHPLKWYQRWLASFAYFIIRLVALTLRFRWEYAPALLENKTRPVIFCIWHNRLALSLLMYEHYVRRVGQEPHLAALVSASKDGGVLARVLEHFRVQPVRGSSSRRGPQALLELTTWAESGYDLAITPDGPRGPCYVVQQGIISLAQITGRPIIPSSQRLHSKIRLRSWDRFQIPLPFSRVTMKFSEPMFVPRDLSEEQREQFRVELEQRLKTLTED